MIADYNISLKLGDDTVQSTLKFHAGDVNGSNLKLHVYNNSKKFNMSGCTAEYDAVIAGHLAESGHAADIDGNTVTLVITKNMTAMDGLLEIDVRILKDGNILGVQTITAHVQRSIIDEETIIDISGTTIGAKLEELDSKKVDKSLTIAGIDLEDDITAEELKAALDIEVSDGAKVFFEIFAPPYYVSDNDYCKVGDIWVDKDISTGQGYRVSVLMSKTYISDPGVYYCSWQPVVPASFNINVLPGGGNLPVHRYSETVGNTEYSYPPYRNGDILTVNGSDYECSVSNGSSYSSTYTYSFKRAVSEADIIGKMSLIPIDPTAEEIEAMPSGQIYGDTVNHKGIVKDGQEFYDTEYIDEALSEKFNNYIESVPEYYAADYPIGTVFFYRNKFYVFKGNENNIAKYDIIRGTFYVVNKNDPPTSESISNAVNSYNVGDIYIKGTATQPTGIYLCVSAARNNNRATYIWKNITSNFEVVQSLPASPSVGTIYLIYEDANPNHSMHYSAWTFVNSSWTKLNMLEKDYYTKDEIDAMIGDIEALLSEV